MRNRWKNYKNFITSFWKEIAFKILNLNISRWVTIIGSIVWIISLFLPWINDTKSQTTYNSFNNIAWNVGFLIIIFHLIIIFLTFGANYKEKMKLYSEIDLKNYVIIIFTWFFIFLAWIMEASFVNWLETFQTWIKYWNWLILAIVSAILIIAWGYLTRKEFYKNSSEIILERLSQERNKDKEKTQISLDF